MKKLKISILRLIAKNGVVKMKERVSKDFIERYKSDKRIKRCEKLEEELKKLREEIRKIEIEKFRIIEELVREYGDSLKLVKDRFGGVDVYYSELEKSLICKFYFFSGKDKEMENKLISEMVKEEGCSEVELVDRIIEKYYSESK
jgi:hypothetical protein